MRWVVSGPEDAGRGAFAPTALLAAAMPQGAADITIGLGSPIDIDHVAVGEFAIVDDEWLMVTAISGSTMTFARGVLDTVPAAHSAGARVYFVEPHYVNHEYVVGETAQLRLLPKTGRGELDVSLASTISRTIQQRFIRPYPPGNVRINGASYPASASGDLTITWAHRDRKQQTAYVVKQSDSSIGPETGTTYTVRIYNAQSGGSLIRTYSGIAGTSQTYTETQADTDNGGTKPADVRIEIESVRDGYTSLQRQVIHFAWT
jgi:hypothetical protein